MNLTGNVVLNLYSIALLVIIYYQSSKQVERDSLQYKIFMLMVKVVILLLIIDIFSRFDTKPDTVYALFNRVGNFMVFLFNMVMPSLWVLYVYDQVLQEERRLKRLFYYLAALNCINAVLVILSQFYGWFYYFDSNNIYHRGPLYALPVSVTGVLLGLAYFFIFKYRKRIERSHCLALTFFGVPPCIGIILLIAFYGISLILNCLVLSLFVIFLSIQNNNLYTDYLTGVNNRKKLDVFLRDKINASSADKTFSAIMLDLDNFKHINDTWGHHEGDQALRMTIKLLGSCLTVNDFVARFGGDEFCIVVDITDRLELEELVQRIKDCFANYNEAGKQPYKLCLSMGYAIYDYHSGMGMEEFQKQLDLLLYDNKKHKRISA